MQVSLKTNPLSFARSETQQDGGLVVYHNLYHFISPPHYLSMSRLKVLMSLTVFLQQSEHMVLKPLFIKCLFERIFSVLPHFSS